MIEIDGSQKSGSGTIVRDAVPFSVLVGKNLHLINIRAKRAKPGLRAQHLKGLEASAQICRGRLEGTKLGSKEITFTPGGQIKGGRFNWDIGTAGSATMLALGVIPLALFADSTSNYKITGGLFQDFAPSVYHLKYVLVPLLREMGADLDLEIIQPGYLPQGKGQIEVTVNPLKKHLRPLTLTDQGRLTEIKGVALSSLLKKRKVSERMAGECQKQLNARGYAPKIEILYDTPEFPVYKKVSVQAGASLAVWARTDTGCLIGSDMAGALRRSAEFIGKRMAKQLTEDLRSGATVDRYLADQIIPFMALAEGWSAYLIPKMTDHIKARLWLIEKILGGKAEVKNNLVRIKGIGYRRE
ncbi:MAG: RNA 3'-phosphate cyclase [Desulfobacteraceae bacterium]|nr:RNA 3'-phosphate cyclase [Desulfobacteraceae bacterium]